MTPVTLDAFERADLKNSAVIRAKYIDEIVATIGFFLGTANGDVAWARARNMAVKITKNPNILLTDSDLMNVFELTMLQREFDKKDTDTVGTLEEQFIAYMASVNGWAFLNDDYYKIRNSGLEMTL
jgi:hypothetical protein